MTTAEQLATLPPPMLAQLLRIYRLAAGMSATEKAEARGLFAAVTFAAAVDTTKHDHIPAAEMVSALGLIVTAADNLATTGKER